MYSRTILLTAASLAVADMASAANAAPMNIRQPVVMREQISATLQFHHYRLPSEPPFVRGH